MSKIVWDVAGNRVYENGVSHGVLYPMSSTPGTYDKGVPWNGLVSVAQSPSGAEPSAIYADNIKYLNLLSAEEFEASIEAYTYPDEFAACDGSLAISAGFMATQQTRKTFALCYRTNVGTDLDPEAGYKLHIIYGALAAPTESSYETVNDSPEAMTFSWELSTTPVAITGFKPAAHVVLDSTKVATGKMEAIEAVLYGLDATTDPVLAAVDPALLLPDEIAAIIAAE